MSALLWDDFEHGPGSAWQRVQTGAGRLEAGASVLRLALDFEQTPATARSGYSNAQIDDYRGLSRRRFPWRPPLSLSLRARFSHRAPVGTAGFGFWNEPFLSTGLRLPALPQAIWFFYAAPPSDMALALDVPGWGWKAAALDALRFPFPLLFPTMPLAIPFMRVRRLYRRLWPLYQRAMRVNEALIELELTAWHSYQIDWLHDSAHFLVDGQPVHICDVAPRGPLGLVIWLDNRWMAATPQGRLRWGVARSSPQHRQWLELDWVRVEMIDVRVQRS